MATGWHYTLRLICSMCVSGLRNMPLWHPPAWEPPRAATHMTKVGSWLLLILGVLVWAVGPLGPNCPILLWIPGIVRGSASLWSVIQPTAGLSRTCLATILSKHDMPGINQSSSLARSSFEWVVSSTCIAVFGSQLPLIA